MRKVICLSMQKWPYVD